MAAKRIEIHPAALEELKSAVEWYLERSEPAADEIRFRSRSRHSSGDRIAVSLAIGEYGVRRFVLQRFPFAITYREKDSGVQILAFAHGHRRPGYWKDRL
jgi:plasmid stabilization system protein ParE